MMTPAQKIMADAMLEADFQQKVIERCEALGLRVWHDEDSRRNRAGLPDLIIVGAMTAFVELKSAKGRLRPEQEAFMTDLQKARAHVMLWRPEHLFDGTVDRVLQQIAGK